MGGTYTGIMIKEIIIKFLNDQCSDYEIDQVRKWVKADAFNEESKKWVFENWRSYQGDEDIMDEEKFSLLFDKIQHRIDDENKKKVVRKSTSPITLFSTWLTKAAAILLIPVLGFLFYTLNEKGIESNKIANFGIDSLEIIAPIGSRSVVQLSDGSEVYLNYNSKIKYPHSFSGNTREVILSGEGFFNVAHNPDKPFIVRTKNLNVTALGTSFNVMAYPDDDNIETTLVDGKVVLSQNNMDGRTQSIGAMMPGQHVKYNKKTTGVICTAGNIEKYIAWKDGKLIFEDTPITQLTDKLSHMFNVEIEVEEDIKDYFYTVTFVNEPLYQILDLMCIATPVSYRILPRKKLPDGTYSKQRIIIEKIMYN